MRNGDSGGECEEGGFAVVTGVGKQKLRGGSQPQSARAWNEQRWHNLRMEQTAKQKIAATRVTAPPALR